MSVSVGPGWIVLTVIPRGPRSARKAACQGSYCALGHCVDRRSRKASAIGCDTTGGDDPSPFTHVRQSGLDGDENSADVDSYHAVERSEVVIADHAASEYPGIVHQDVEAAEAVDGFRHGGLHRVGISAVGVDGQGCSTVRFDYSRKGRCLFTGSGVGEGDGRAIPLPDGARSLRRFRAIRPLRGPPYRRVQST
jgi:hypothetical protein